MGISRKAPGVVVVAVVALVIVGGAAALTVNRASRPALHPPATHTPGPRTSGPGSSEPAAPEHPEVVAWFDESRADIVAMTTQAQKARMNRDACNDLYTAVMFTQADLPAPDKQLGSLLYAASMDYYRATQACQFRIGLVAANMDHGDAHMRQVVERGQELGVRI